MLLNDIGVFDCRISQLPTKSLVVDYFRWRNEDASRNALNSHCYWLLREEGKKPDAVAKRLSGVSVADKNELLFERGINFNDIPTWQKRGIGIYWEIYEKSAKNMQTGEAVTATRKRLKVDYDLPMKGEYSSFIGSLLENTE